MITEAIITPPCNKPSITSDNASDVQKNQPVKEDEPPFFMGKKRTHTQMEAAYNQNESDHNDGERVIKQATK